ncbi:MAG TPA: ParB/RepB/Spo0J family partition protein [Candidatus Saccharimonadales bacterium]|nr:ParB/RepB/Spo0J family partition protein [Candidatus Saccharimonadales bacterium]
MAVKKGLGRGFDSLIPTDVIDETFDSTSSQDGQVSELRYLKLAQIKPDPEQPRREFDPVALEELSESIKAHGLIQPIVVTPLKGSYQLVAGERRYRAAKLAGIDKLPALVRTLSDQHKLEIALIENVQRRDLNILETATAYLKLHQQFNLSYEEIGARVGGKAFSTVSNTLRLLKLPEAAKRALVARDISEGHARQILALKTEAEQLRLLKLIIANGWSVRQAEQYVIGHKKGEQTAAKRDSGLKHTQTETDFTRHLATRLELPVKQKTTAKGGQIIISFKTEQDLDQLKQRIGL